MKKLRKKNRVLIFVDWFYPAFKAGGPIKSIHHIAESLSHEIDFYILTSNTDIGSEVIEVPTNKWVEREFYSVIYLDASHQSINFYQKIEKEIEPDVIYYNNMFSLNFGIKPLWLFRKRRNIKQLIAPRGMLGQGALRIKSRKKMLFLSIAKNLLFQKTLVWHASSPQEGVEIKKVIGKHAKVQIAKNLTNKPHRRDLADFRKYPKELKLVFISRISEKKNLLFLLKLIANLKSLTGLKLDVFGPIEDRIYWKECESIINADDRINYKGTLKPFEIDKTLLEYHFFILPTHHENFGHVIAEAINVGVPVIISEHTPWQNLKKYKVGFDLELADIISWENKLKTLYLIDQAAFKEMVNACFTYANTHIVNSANLAANKKLFSLENKN